MGVWEAGTEVVGDASHELDYVFFYKDLIYPRSLEGSFLKFEY